LHLVNSRYWKLKYQAYSQHRAIGTFIGDTVVDIDYPLAFCNAMIQQQPAGEKFRYVHLGGGVTEPPDSERNLWYYAKARRVRVCCPVAMVVDR
jgi:hypothetical protein